LAQRDEWDLVAAAAEDESWHVRLEVARSLAQRSGEHASALSAKLLNDASPHVQQQVISSLAQWPQEAAGPLLLAAMSQKPYLVRKAARDQLAKRWPAAEAFIVDAPAESRKAKL